VSRAKPFRRGQKILFACFPRLVIRGVNSPLGTNAKYKNAALTAGTERSEGRGGEAAGLVLYKTKINSTKLDVYLMSK
jgi:hypothetical protein